MSITPSQLAAHERSKAFRAKIAEQAERLSPRKDTAYFRETIPFRAEDVAQPVPSEVLPPIPNEEIRAACDFVIPVSNRYGPKIEFIYRTVAMHFGISYTDMLSARRTRNIVRPRQVAMYLAKTLTLRSLPEIARRMGDRDHTTALHGVNRIKSLMESDAELAADIAKLKEMLT